MNRLEELITFLNVGSEGGNGVHLSSRQADEISSLLISFDGGLKEIKAELKDAKGWESKNKEYIQGLEFAKECFE